VPTLNNPLFLVSDEPLLIELQPRVGSPRPPASVLRPGFTLCVVNTSEGLRVFLETPVSSETLSRFYRVKKSNYKELFKVFSNVVWASDGRRYRAVFSDEKSLFDRICREEYSVITVSVGDVVMECRVRDYGGRFVVKPSLLELLDQSFFSTFSGSPY